MFGSSDRLLYVVSARLEMPWAAFKNAYDWLLMSDARSHGQVIDHATWRRWRTAQCMDWLALCDFVFGAEGGRVYIGPPGLVRLPHAGLPRAILVGARSVSTINRLRESCKVISRSMKLSVTEQGADFPHVPVRVIVEAEGSEELAKVASSLGIFFQNEPAAWNIGQFAASIEDYLNDCTWTESGELTWDRQDFDFDTLQFVSSRSGAGLRLSRYVNPRWDMPAYFLWLNGRRAQVDLDWGKYALLREAKKNVVVYDEQQYLMAVPARTSPPKLLARSAVLCSGLVSIVGPPELGLGSATLGNFHVFREVPCKIAELIAFKLGQSLIVKSLDAQSKGE